MGELDEVKNTSMWNKIKRFFKLFSRKNTNPTRIKLDKKLTRNMATIVDMTPDIDLGA